jgi:glutamyl-tRNA synthetase
MLSQDAPASRNYRGRVAPTPTGLLHLGHARTFWTAFERSRGGTLIYREEDLDKGRCKAEFALAAVEDLRWLGIKWVEGPDMGGSFGPYRQSERGDIYREVFERLRESGAIYPCHCSRQDVLRSLSAPHVGDEEPVYPGTCRPGRDNRGTAKAPGSAARPCWRYRIPDGEEIRFDDSGFGPQCFLAGRDFGDFVVWTRDDIPSYQLAVVADDALMRVTEVVRGADLLLSAARQILLYRALGWNAPAFHHCPLVTDATGARLAKRHDALSLRQLRLGGATPEQVRETARGPAS